MSFALKLLLCFFCFFTVKVQAAVENNFSDAKIVDIQFSGARLPEQLKAKISSIKGQNFSQASIRYAIQWFHESGGDSYIEISGVRINGGLRLVVYVKEKLRIANILFSGNKAISSNALLVLSEIKEGTDYDAELIKAALSKISLFYSKQGYLASEIHSSFDEKTNELTFNVSEGEPTLIGSLSISPISNIENKLLKKRYEGEIAELFGLKAGERIQRDLVIEGVQKIKDWLRDHDFLTASEPKLEYQVSEDGKVDLKINIIYGPRIRYGFRGNFHFSYRELMVFVGEIKEVSTGSDYLAAVRRRVLEAYNEIGYANAKISTLVREDADKGIRYVSLIINEENKIKITKINISGLSSISVDEARRVFHSFSTRLVQRDFFHEAGINKAAELFADHLRSKGFLSAKLEFTKFDFNQDRTKVEVSLLYSEGMQTKVSEVQINGLKAFEEKEVLEILSLHAGEPFNIFAFEKGLIKIKEKYEEVGNLSAAITNEGTDTIVRYSRDNANVRIQLDISEGPVYKVGDILVRGNQVTHARVVLRELPFISGDLLTRPLMTEAEDNLRRLNLFGSVILRPIDRPGDDTVKDILILVEETTPGSFEVAPGYRNDLGLRLALGLAYQNIGGWNRSFTTKLTFNRRTENYRFLEYRASFGFREPYLANWPVVFTSNLDFLKSQLTAADVNISRITNGVKRDLTKYLSGLLEHTYERVEVSNIDTVRTKYTKDDERIDYIGALIPGFIIDSRNDIYNPTKGFYSLGRFEVASQFFGSSNKIGYYKSTLNNSLYLPFFDDLVLAMAANIGYERSNVSGQKIPLIKLYRLGGVGSVRGYSDGEINLDTSKNFFGTMGLINYRGELRWLLSPTFGSALFLDAGNLLVDRFTLAPNDLRSAFGAGFRYITPVGPVAIDFAWRAQKDKKVGDTEVEGFQDRFKFHFSIGTF